MFQGFKCEADGKRVAPAACLSCARAGAKGGCAMTGPVVKGIIDARRPDDFEVTVTTLLSCPRKYFLKQQADYVEKPSSLWWAYRGQLMHGIAEAYAAENENVLAESRYYLVAETPDGEELAISGQIDLVDVARKHLLDYKTTKSVPTRMVCPQTGEQVRRARWPFPTFKCKSCGQSHATDEICHPGEPYSSHVQQVSLYRILLEENGIDIDTAEIVYQDMSRQVRVPVALMPRDAAWAMLESRLALFHTGKLPAPIDPASREAWQCDYCPVRQACQTQQENEGQPKSVDTLLAELGF